MIDKTIEFNRFINGILNSNSINQKHKSNINAFILKEYGIDLSNLSKLDKLLYYASSSENEKKSKYVPLIEHLCEFFSPETKKHIINCFINGFEGREYGTVLNLQLEPYWLDYFKNQLISENGWELFDIVICPSSTSIIFSNERCPDKYVSLYFRFDLKK